MYNIISPSMQQEYHQLEYLDEWVKRERGNIDRLPTWANILKYGSHSLNVALCLLVGFVMIPPRATDPVEQVFTWLLISSFCYAITGALLYLVVNKWIIGTMQQRREKPLQSSEQEMMRIWFIWESKMQRTLWRAEKYQRTSDPDSKETFLQRPEVNIVVEGSEVWAYNSEGEKMTTEEPLPACYIVTDHVGKQHVVTGETLDTLGLSYQEKDLF